MIGEFFWLMVGNLGIRLTELAGRHRYRQRTVIEEVKEQWASPNLFKWGTKSSDSGTHPEVSPTGLVKW